MYSLIIHLIITCFFSFAAHAEIYKWVDEDGRTHYGEKPAVNNADKIEIREKPEPDKATKERLEKRDRLLEIIEEERAQEQQKQQEEKIDLEQLAKRCNELRDSLDKLASGGTTYYQIDEDGNRAYMSEQDVAIEAEKIQKEHKKNCQGR